MNVTIANREVNCVRVSINSNFTNESIEKTVFMELARPFDDEVVYYSLLQNAEIIQIAYPYGDTHTYEIDTSDKTKYSIAHTFESRGEQMSISLPLR